MTSQAVGGTSLQYVYPGRQNNGQIAQMVDAISGETVSYQYDALKRLSSASGTPNAGSTPSAWTQSYQYDGFGSMTTKVTNGTTASIAVNAATNRLTNATYDLNGNMTTGLGGTFGYDEANRMVSAQEVSGGIEYFGYAADNKRILRVKTDGTKEWTFYGAQGERLGMFQVKITEVLDDSGNYAGDTFLLNRVGSDIWFDGREVGWGPEDGLKSGRSGGVGYYPYGDTIAAPVQEGLQFASYMRDGYTGLDYADQRYYASAYGRFASTDPAGANSKPNQSLSWNRYSYVDGDPVNSLDPSGTEQIFETICGPAGTCEETGIVYYCGSSPWTGEPYPWDPACEAYGYVDPPWGNSGNSGIGNGCINPYDAARGGFPIGIYPILPRPSPPITPPAPPVAPTPPPGIGPTWISILRRIASFPLPVGIGAATLGLTVAVPAGGNEEATFEEDKYYRQYEADVAICRLGRNSCYDQAAQRLGACLAHNPLPPFPYEAPSVPSPCRGR